MEIVVLGSGGYVGRRVVEQSLELPGVTSRGLYRNNKPRLVNARAFQAVEGELGHCPEQLFPESPFVLVHLATKQIDRDNTGFDVNVIDTESMLRRLPPSCQGIIYGSSMSVYGNNEQQGAHEASLPRADTELAKSRLAVERLLKEYAAQQSIWSINLRPRFVLGRGDKYVLPGLVKLFKYSVSLGNGSQKFSIIDVDDYASIILMLATLINQGASPQQIALNVGYDQAVSMSDIETVICGPDYLPKFRLVSSPRIIRLLDTIFPKKWGLGEKLRLLGQSHVGSVEKLKSLIGADIVGRNPLTRVMAARSYLSCAPQSLPELS